jgi:hypothetical protein
MADAVSFDRKKTKVTPEPARPKAVKKADLDSDEIQDQAKKLLEFRRQARINQAENRAEMATDQDYYDGLQWSDEDILVMEERGQAPLVFNLAATTLRWVTGTEKRTRIDFRVLARRKDGVKAAQVKTSLLKYLQDVNKAQFERSRAFADAAITGLGWLEDGIKNDPEDEPLFIRYESWRNVWYDPLSIAADMSDARFLFREKWVDLDVAQLMFPARKEDLASAADNILTSNQQNAEFGTSFNPYLYGDPDSFGTVYGEPGDVMGMGSRKRVLLCEAWYRVPQKVKVLRGDGTWNGSIYNPADGIHRWALESGVASTHDAVKMTMRLMIMCVNRNGFIVCQDSPSPYWHNRFTLTPVWGYRRGRDNAPYGIMRGLRDASDDFNKRRAKALQLMSTRQVIADKGAVENKSDAIDEMARPDGWIEKKPGSTLEIKENTQLAPAHINMMEQDARYIQEAAGVTDENLGRQTNAISGKAIEARQNQGYTATSDLFDNLRLAIQLSGERQLSLIEQFYDDEKTLRVTGERRSDLQFVMLNDLDGVNPITEAQADFVVDEQDFRSTTRQAMFDTIMEMVPKLPPEIGLKILSIAFEMSDVPMKDEFLKVLREATGMPDPDQEDDPQEMAVRQAKDQEAQAQNAAQMEDQRRQVAAQLALIEGKAKAAIAEGNKKELEALSLKLEALKKSMEVAGGAAANPMLAKAADQLMADITRVPTVNNIAPPIPPNVATPMASNVPA